jgi:hypothetical protein
MLVEHRKRHMVQLALRALDHLQVHAKHGRELSGMHRLILLKTTEEHLNGATK